MREGVYWRGSLSDRGFYWRVGEFSERGGGAYRQKGGLMGQRERFSARGAY